jgi:hypothetical protein
MMRKQRMAKTYIRCPCAGTYASDGRPSPARGFQSRHDTSGASTMKPCALLVALLVMSGTARAAECLSLPQARAAHPGKYVSYRLDHGRKCWGNNGPLQRTIARHRAPPPLQTSVPVPRSTVLWPALSLTATPVDAALFTTEPATAWPRLLDIDDVTAEPLADCCWPPLDEPPFRERWTALPSNWFELIGGMK